MSTDGGCNLLTRLSNPRWLLNAECRPLRHGVALHHATCRREDESSSLTRTYRQLITPLRAWSEVRVTSKLTLSAKNSSPYFSLVMGHCKL